MTAASRHPIPAPLGPARPGDRVTWLGYDTPGITGPDVLTDARARDAAPPLQDFVARVHGMNPQAEVTLLCHSYGPSSAAAPPLG
ncbi:alpha/beta hydrolase [Streptomyces sp. CB02009]|uniref:alpha/beta hydrolase n=1 Tax=Streptomyces sp. CB02009 TaxID=1703938 RepID=UPI0013018186|nr:alpha/beta hydrolase [Streptomyces sp. CB02009]